MNITKLTADTASAASLKGVITRSQYLEAKKPVDSKGLLLKVLKVTYSINARIKKNC